MRRVIPNPVSLFLMCFLLIGTPPLMAQEVRPPDIVFPTTTPPSDADIIVGLFGYYEPPNVVPPTPIDATKAILEAQVNANKDAIIESLMDIYPAPFDIASDFTDQLKDLHEARPELTIPLGIGLLSAGTFFAQSLLEQYGDAVNVGSISFPIPKYETVIMPSDTSSIWLPRIPIELIVIPKITIYEDPTKTTSGSINIGIQF